MKIFEGSLPRHLSFITYYQAFEKHTTSVCHHLIYHSWVFSKNNIFLWKIFYSKAILG